MRSVREGRGSPAEVKQRAAAIGSALGEQSAWSLQSRDAGIPAYPPLTKSYREQSKVQYGGSYHRVSGEINSAAGRLLNSRANETHSSVECIPQFFFSFLLFGPCLSTDSFGREQTGDPDAAGCFFFPWYSILL
jgi:hypothetical protein